ncbi:MAG: TIGR03621 family F420-dependent LLM class oxidoreductase [Acidimicrobiales bacterium]
MSAARTQKPFRFAASSAAAGSAGAWTELARRVEGSGYSTLYVADHYVDAASNGGQQLAAIPAIMAAAAVTTTLRVGARVLCIDYHQPVVLAKQAATIDLLSDGRFDLGLGAGWVGSEYEAMGLVMDDAPTRIARLADTVAFVRRFFAGEALDGGTGSVAASGFVGQPQPVQAGGPPIMIGGGARKVLTLAGQVADIVSFNFDNRAGRVGPESVQSAAASVMEQRIAWVRDGAGDRFDRIELEVGAYFTIVTPDTPTAQVAADKMGEMFGMSADDMLAHPNALIGTVDEICDRLVERRERYGISFVTVSERNLDAFAPVVARLAGT